MSSSTRTRWRWQGCACAPSMLRNKVGVQTFQVPGEGGGVEQRRARFERRQSRANLVREAGVGAEMVRELLVIRQRSRDEVRQAARRQDAAGDARSKGCTA